MYSPFQNYLLDAVDTVLAWEIPEAAFNDAVKSQACLMAGINPDEVMGFYPD